MRARFSLNQMGVTSLNLPGKIIPGPTLPQLEHTHLALTASAILRATLPQFKTTLAGRFASLTPRNEFVFYTIDPALQTKVEAVIEHVRAPHVAAVMMDPSTGKVLAMAGRSTKLKNPVMHGGFPAASLFKLVTAAAAVEENGIRPSTPIRFRGGNYTLSKTNYSPSTRYDNRSMTVGNAMGKSVNPVFGRLALALSSPITLERYASSFGFNEPFATPFALPMSRAAIPIKAYEIARTGAGFGDVFLSPLHAAALMSGIATGGILHQPSLIEKVVSPKGKVLYHHEPIVVAKMMASRTATSLLDMMENTTKMGTSRKQFSVSRSSPLHGMRIPGKTGTLKGKNPTGLTTWFIGSAPRVNPEYAVAVVSVAPKSSSARASAVARKILEASFQSNYSG